MKSLRDLSKIEIHRRSMKIVAVSNTSRYMDNNEKNWKEYLETIPREILVDLYNDIRNHSSENLHAGLNSKEIVGLYLQAIWLETVFYASFAPSYNDSTNIHDYLKKP